VQAVQAVQGVQGVQAAQAPAWNGAAPQKGAMPGKGGRPGPQAPAITVTGCRNPTVANIVNGVYNAVDTNHGKPVYKKEASPTNVLIYFWDERDGATFGGWWLGPKVGGDQVWAYSMNKTSSLPPANGWKVPWDGPVDDSLVLSYGGKGSSQGLQQPQQQQQPGQWGMPVMDEAERQRREVERQRQIAEFKLKQEEQKKRDEEMKKLQKEKEEELAREQAEQRKKQEEENLRWQEDTAAGVVREIIKRVRVATPENYDDLRDELEHSQSEQLDWMGHHAEKVYEESERALDEAQRRVEKIIAKREADERDKVEKVARRKEEVLRIEQLTKRASEEVTDAEAKVAKVDEMAKPISVDVPDLSPEAMLEVVQQTSGALAGAQELLDSVSKSLTERRCEMGSSELATGKLKEDFHGFYKRLAVCRRTVESLSEISQVSKERALRKRDAQKRALKTRDEFTTYDLDKDGLLNRSEITQLAKGFGFSIPDYQLDRIQHSLFRGAGVPLERFPRLRSMVAIARSEVRANEKNAVAIEQERVKQEHALRRERDLKEKKAHLQKLVEVSEETSKTLDKATSKAEELVKAGERPLSAEELKLQADAGDSEIEKAKLTLDKLMEQIKEIEKDCDSDENLKLFQKEEATKVSSEAEVLLGRLNRVGDACRLARDLAVRRSFNEMEVVRNSVVTALRTLMQTEIKTGNELFEQINGGESLTCDQFANFLQSLPDLDLGDKCPKLFVHIAEGQDVINQATFLELTRLFYKVVKPTVLTELMSIKSKLARRLEVGEVVEGLENPRKDDEAGVMRVRCRCVADGALGFVTLAGNQGSIFLEPGGNFYVVVKPTPFTDGLSVNSQTLRELSKGEVIEVHEFEKRDIPAGVTRIRGKSKRDGMCGWVTVVGSRDEVLLERC